MKNKFNKTGTVFSLFVKTYVEFICVLIISIIILIVLVGFVTSKLTGNTLPNIGLYNKVGQTYETFNTSEIEEMGGSVEVIDENNKVIFRKGNIDEKKESYTQQELLRFNYLSSLESNGKLRILNSIEVNTISVSLTFNVASFVLNSTSPTLIISSFEAPIYLLLRCALTLAETSNGLKGFVI